MNENQSEAYRRLYDVIEMPVEGDITRSQKENMDYLMKHNLEDQERNILRERYGLDGEPASLETIAAKYEMTRLFVRKIESAALQKLKETARNLKEVYIPL